ncbi:MAG TPA: hypothetical protein VG476_11725 [Acidimicrobiales bacterium]|nr:hypothetical protein [Acidimicrobiales bacterium]
MLQQHPEMPAHRGRRHPGRLGQLASSAGAGAEQLHDCTPRGVAQGHEQRRHLIVEVLEVHDHIDNS